MGTSFSSIGIRWNLVSTITGYDDVTYEYECPVPNSNKKYNLSKVVTPDGVHLSFGVR